MKKPGIDYSKWDNIDSQSDDDEEEQKKEEKKVEKKVEKAIVKPVHQQQKQSQFVKLAPGDTGSGLNPFYLAADPHTFVPDQEDLLDFPWGIPQAENQMASMMRVMT